MSPTDVLCIRQGDMELILHCIDYACMVKIGHTCTDTFFPFCQVDYAADSDSAITFKQILAWDKCISHPTFSVLWDLCFFVDLRSTAIFSSFNEPSKALNPYGSKPYPPLKDLQHNMIKNLLKNWFTQ